MLLQSTTKPPILGVLTKHHISEAFCIDFVNRSMLLRSKTKPPFFSIRGGLTKHFFCYKGGNRASVQIDSKKKIPPMFCFLIRGVIIKGGGD